MVIAVALALVEPAPLLAEPTPAYPVTAKVDQVDVQFGEAIADPYRWLEGDVRSDARVHDWVAAQNVVSHAYLAALPARPAFAARLHALFDFERMGTPRKAGTRYFYKRNTGLQNQSTLWVREAGAAEGRLLIDPNRWASDGATALAEWMPSDDGGLLAYAVQEGGSDWRTLRLLDVATGKVLDDKIEWVKFSAIAWAHDGSGFFHLAFAPPAPGKTFQAANLNQQIRFHRVGTQQADDPLVYATPDRPTLGHSARVTDDGRWLVVTSHEGTDPKVAVAIAALTGGPITVRPLIARMDNDWRLAGSVGARFWFVTDRDAPKGRIVVIDVAARRPRPVAVIAETRDTIVGASLVGDRLVVAYLGDAKSQAELFDLEGHPKGTVHLPDIGSASGFSGRAGDSETFYTFTSFATPPTVYRFDSATNASTPVFTPAVAFDPARYRTEQIFYPSKDGTRIPMFVVRRTDLPPGPRPTLLYGYGGFNVALTPSFSAGRLAWLEAGGVYAIANLRGGGEYGKAWHDAGKRANKQNVFDDFIAGAEFLIAQGVTTPVQLAIQGGSNGGLLVAAVVNQRPELFAAALPSVGVMDMLRFDRFTAGRYWIDDYGNPAVAADWHVLRRYSPLHNIGGGRDYPAILVTTGDTDDRVVPGHSFKYTAALQAAAIGPRPRLIRIETRAGHGSGKPTDKLIEETADEWAFAARWTGLMPGN